nr:YggT family protein [Pseudanabaena mucicola]
MKLDITMDAIAISSLALNIVLGLFILMYIFRIIMTWYPQIPLNQFPYSLITFPTEPLLFVLRKLIPPIGGIDISPVIGVGIFSLLREMLLGQQGILTMMQ